MTPHPTQWTTASLATATATEWRGTMVSLVVPRTPVALVRIQVAPKALGPTPTRQMTTECMAAASAASTAMAVAVVVTATVMGMGMLVTVMAWSPRQQRGPYGDRHDPVAPFLPKGRLPPRAMLKAVLGQVARAGCRRALGAPWARLGPPPPACPGPEWCPRAPPRQVPLGASHSRQGLQRHAERWCVGVRALRGMCSDVGGE